jgi:NAD(P)-dependent dehydrogenase (short-subunit alcohol dehydrogenase family)
VACCRSPDTSQDLQEYISSVSKQYSAGRIQLVTLDVENQQSIEAAASKIQERYNRVDLLLNVAGILGDGTTTPGPERSLSKMDRSWVEKTLAVNVIGPVMLCKELAPLMKSKTTAKGPGGRPISVVANLSARVGSIADNELGGWYSYRLSKAALNQATRTMAHELKQQGTWSIALHPGTTDTDLSKPFQRNVQEGRLFPVEFTVSQLLAVIDSMEDRNSGGLYDWSGKALPF